MIGGLFVIINLIVLVATLLSSFTGDIPLAFVSMLGFFVLEVAVAVGLGQWVNAEKLDVANPLIGKLGATLIAIIIGLAGNWLVSVGGFTWLVLFDLQIQLALLAVGCGVLGVIAGVHRTDFNKNPSISIISIHLLTPPQIPSPFCALAPHLLHHV